MQNIKRNNSTLLIASLGMITLLGFIAISFLTINSGQSSFLVGKLGVSLAKANTIISMIESGAAAAQIIGLVGAGTGVGLALAGAMATLRYLIKSQLKKAAISL